MRKIVTDNAGDRIETNTNENAFAIIHTHKIIPWHKNTMLLNEAEVLVVRDRMNEWLKEGK